MHARSWALSLAEQGRLGIALSDDQYVRYVPYGLDSFATDTEEEHALAYNPPATKALVYGTIYIRSLHFCPSLIPKAPPLCAVLLHRYMEILRTLRPIITNSRDNGLVSHEGGVSS